MHGLMPPVRGHLVRQLLSEPGKAVDLAPLARRVRELLSEFAGSAHRYRDFGKITWGNALSSAVELPLQAPSQRVFYFSASKKLDQIRPNS